MDAPCGPEGADPFPAVLDEGLHLSNRGTDLVFVAHSRSLFPARPIRRGAVSDKGSSSIRATVRTGLLAPLGCTSLLEREPGRTRGENSAVRGYLGGFSRAALDRQERSQDHPEDPGGRVSTRTP